MEGLAACFEDLKDPRTGNAGQHDLIKIMVIALCTVLSGFSHSRSQPPRLVAMKAMAVKAALDRLKGVSDKIEFPSARRMMRWLGRLFNSFAERKRRNDERR